MEFVGDTEFVSELLMAVDVAVKFMEVNIAWLSRAFDALLTLDTDVKL